MVQGVFHKIADRFHQPVPVAPQRCRIIAGQDQRFPLLRRPVGKLCLDPAHYFGYVVLRLVNHDRSRVQFGDFEQVLNQRFDPVEFLLGEGCKFPDGLCIVCILLYDAVIDIQRSQRGFELVGNIRNGILHKPFGSSFVFGMGVQDSNKRVDLVEQAVQLTFFVAFDPGVPVPRDIVLDLRRGVFDYPALRPEIQIQRGENSNPHADTRQKHINRRML